MKKQTSDINNLNTVFILNALIHAYNLSEIIIENVEGNEKDLYKEVLDGIDKIIERIQRFEYL